MRQRIFQGLRSLWLSGGVLLLLGMQTSLASPATTCDARQARGVIDHVLNWDLNGAISALAAWERREEDDPSLPLYRAIIEIAAVDYAPGLDPHRFDAALDDLAAVIRLNEQRLLETPGERLLRYNLATAKAISGRLLMERHDWLAAYRHGRAARRMMRDLLAEDPEFADAYLVLGMFEYFTGTLPSVIKWLSALIGLPGDVEKGRRDLEYAVTHAKVAAPYAADSILLEFQHDPASACRYRALAHAMRQHYPRNPRYASAVRRLDNLCTQLPPDQRPVASQLRLPNPECS